MATVTQPKSFLTITTDSKLPSEYSAAVKSTGIDMTGSYYTFGTTLYFPPKKEAARQSGGIGFFTTANSTTGYFIRVKTAQTAGLKGDEFTILKIVNGSIVKTFSDSVSVNKSVAGIEEGKAYKLDVFVKHTGSIVEIKAYINGYVIKGTDTSSIIAKSSNIALYANLGTAHFDYAYAIKLTEDDYSKQLLTDIYDAQFAKAVITLTNGEFFAKGIGKVDSGTTERYVEEFQSIAREIRYVSKRYDTAPSLPKYVYTNLNSSVKVIYSSIMPFQAELWLINNSGATSFVDSALATQINVIGNNIIKSSGVVYEENETNKFSVQEPISFEAEWIQDINDAESLSKFIKSQWAKSNIVVTLKVFGNPLVSVHDLITISHAFSEIDPAQKFIVTGVNHSWNNGLETTITARSIVV